MVNFQKEVNYAPEGKGGGSSGSCIGGKVADVLDFAGVKGRIDQQNRITRKFDVWCARNKEFVEKKDIQSKVRIDEYGAYFSLPSGEVFLPFGLGDECSFEDANKDYDIRTVCEIFNIFTLFTGSYRYKSPYDDPVNTFFRDVMQWKEGSSIWISEKNRIVDNEENDNTLLYRAQGLTYDNNIIGGNIPREDYGKNDSKNNNVTDDNVNIKAKILLFAGNGVAIMDSENPEKAFSFPE